MEGRSVAHPTHQPPGKGFVPKIRFGEIRSVRMLGVSEPIKFKRSVDGLTVQMPDRDYTHVLKIEG
jgi:hypothetical protein